MLLTQGDIEPAGKQLEEPGQASEQRELELVVVRQVDQDRPQACLQSIPMALQKVEGLPSIWAVSDISMWPAKALCTTDAG